MVTTKKVFAMIVVALCAFCIFVSRSHAATYYVSGSTGNDSNPGTLESPWKTINKANQTLQAGDTVYIRAGTYSITGSGIDPTNTGISGSPIIYSNFNDEEVEFVGASSSSRAVDLDSEYGTVRSYIKVHGINFSNFGTHMWIRKGDYNEISYCTFDGMYGNTPYSWRGSTIYRGATYNHVHDCTFTNYGSFTPNDESVVFELGNEAANDDGTSFNLIEDNEFGRAGHHVIGINGHHNVIRNNYIHNEPWSEYDGTNYGNRAFFMVGHDGDDERNLVEGNRIAYASGCADNEIGGSGGTLASRYNIIRKNMIYQNGIYGFIIKVYSGQGTSINNHIYNNVFWYNGYTETESQKDWFHNQYTHAILVTESDNARDNRIKNNIFWDHPNLTNSSEAVINWSSVAPTMQELSDNWKGTSDPKFVNISGTPDPDKETQFSFYLHSDSPCIDNGGFLTTITSANGSGTQFVVDNAGYFMDGWGIIEGDTIQLEGQSDTATITTVNYDTNTITVDTSLTWTQGLGISLEYNGTAPDIGAYEFVAAPTNLMIVN